MKSLWIMLLLGLTACVSTTVYKDLEIVNKDKSRGQIYMRTDFNSSANPVINYAQAEREAIRQCQFWRYKGVTLSTDFDLKCTEGTEEQCKHYEVTYIYQCLTAQALEESPN